MATYAVSFSLAWDDKYSERYNSVMNHLRAQGKTWEETTSFVLVESSKVIATFERDLYIMTKIDATRDKILVIEVQYDNAHARGVINKAETLRSLLYGIVIH